MKKKKKTGGLLKTTSSFQITETTLIRQRRILCLEEVEERAEPPQEVTNCFLTARV